MSQPFTDIVCLVHNQLAITKGFVKHLYDHTENFRLIFVDNNSDDGTSEWLKDNQQKYNWHILTAKNDEGEKDNLGVIGGRNLGAEYVTADYFVNIDNDQYVGANWLQILHDKMSQGFDIVGCEAWRLVPPGKGGAVVIDGQSHNRFYYPYHRCQNKHEKFTYIGCGGMLIRRKVYDEIGLFDDRYNPAYFEDPDFCFRAIQSGFKLGWCPECPINHLSHQTFNNQRLFDKNKQFLLSWNKFKSKWKTWFPEEGEQ